MDGYGERQRVIANNIANINTPGFKAGKVDFEEEISKAIQSGKYSKVDNVTPKFNISNEESFLRNDGNNVNLEMEMSKLGKTTRAYKTYLKLAKWRLDLLKGALTKTK